VPTSAPSPSSLRRERSEKLFAQSQLRIPGGVNSPVRAFRSVGGSPFFVSRAAGAFIHDVDGNRYIDYVCSYGPLILGHAAPEVIARIQEAAAQGTSFGAPTGRELQLAEHVHRAVPSVEKIRFTSSGTEATMSALRLSRGATGRTKLIKFSGGYHGHADPFLTDAGSGVATLGIPGSAGVPAAVAADVLTVPYNDLAAVEACFTQYARPPEAQDAAAGIAAIMVEPVACNMGMVLPNPDFLPGLRRLCDAHGALLIFDEVITGFRVGFGGAQGHYGVVPDLTTFGKIIGGGLPVGAYGGRQDLMDQVAPCGPVYQAGTLSGNPLAMAAGIATLEQLGQGDFYTRLEKKAAGFAANLQAVLARHGDPFVCCRIGSIVYFYFRKKGGLPQNYADIQQGDKAAYARFFQQMLSKGVYMAPSSFEVGFISAAHSVEDLETTVERIDQVLSMADATAA
jgi:glutamate-1-semialdehyde 2,1-aminomutase